jgi:hypothetical protein
MFFRDDDFSAAQVVLDDLSEFGGSRQKTEKQPHAQ